MRYVLPGILLFIAGALQGNMPMWLSIKGARPDLILVVLIATALTMDSFAGSVLGFLAGLIHGSIVEQSLGSFIVSRTIVGFAAGMVTVRLFSENPMVPVVAAGGLTFVGEGIFLLANPAPDLAASVTVVFWKSLFNSSLTLIAYWLLRWIEIRRKIKMANARI
jgi:rod shape-determining protein MreD